MEDGSEIEEQKDQAMLKLLTSVRQELNKAWKHSFLINMFTLLAGFCLGFAVAMVIL